MIQGNAKGYCKLVMAQLKEMGYQPQLFLINAADCGVPQRRERVFFCAVRNDVSNKKLELAPKHRWITTGEAVSDLQDLTKEEIADTKISELASNLWKNTKQGDNFQKACEKLTGKSSWFSNSKLNELLPSCTLTATHTNSYHYKKDRNLTLREFKRLGSFPDDYKTKTDKIGKYMIGMSVPPKMTEQVAKAVCSQWLGVNYGSHT